VSAAQIHAVPKQKAKSLIQLAGPPDLIAVKAWEQK
jgi:hypothetical protein